MFPHTLLFLLAAAGVQIPASSAFANTPQFFSEAGREHQVSYRAPHESRFRNLDEVRALDDAAKQRYLREAIEPITQYLFGPLTYRELGNPKRSQEVSVDWASARDEAGRVLIDYEYKGHWIVEKDLVRNGTMELPIPVSTSALLTPGWKACTDRAPDHQTESMLWYYWDPSRTGCDHHPGRQFNLIRVKIGEATPNTENTLPEYSKMIRQTSEGPQLTLTFGFGYVEDPANPDPEKDRDAGAAEYRDFVRQVRENWPGGLMAVKETKILQGEYRSARNPDKVIGRRFSGRQGDLNVVVNVVAAAGIDAMEIFAESFAHDHDGFFAWLGHSRLGNGFDARNFERMLKESPDYYSVKPDYQLVYWGGCNSYAYYTLPFFRFKADASGGADPKGTLGLDIIANGLPSYFHLNSENSLLIFRALIGPERKTSYQQIVRQLETEAARSGIRVLVAVLGDEDNPR